jgi:CheY-like chemotaxis protein
LKEDPVLCEIPVIMLSIVDNRNLGLALGASEYLTKPVERERLIAILQKYVCAHPPCRVMIVDDDEDARKRLRQMLEGENWKVTEASDGGDALLKMDDHRPELILLDLLMPGMDGFEFSLQLGRSPGWRDIPVVVLTAKDITAEDRKRLNGHVERILQKGALSQEELLAEICRAAESHRVDG